MTGNRMLYLDCSMGVAGDMLSAALLDLLPDPDGFIAKMSALGIPHVTFAKKQVEKCGINGLHYEVLVDGKEELDHHDHDDARGSDAHHHHDDHRHHHSHHGLADIVHIIDGLDIPSHVKESAKAAFMLIAQAESQVHGQPIDHIHFHEVGSMDAVADVVSACLLMDELSPDKVIASSISTGFGFVQCAHGTLPVPAPATALILEGIPVRAGDVEGELCTPTGAALIKCFATSFGQMPGMVVESTGYGMGTKDFPTANCVRAFMGKAFDQDAGGSNARSLPVTPDLASGPTEAIPDPNPDQQIVKLECNMDDMTAESVAFAIEELLNEGALEAFATPITMKKGRPGILLSILCQADDEPKMVDQVFAFTSTIGIRRMLCDRYVLDRRIEKVDTPYGMVRVKVSSGYGVKRSKIEFDDLAAIAKQTGLAPEAIRQEIMAVLQGES